MKVKQVIEMLSKVNPEYEFVIKGQSGQPWEFDTKTTWVKGELNKKEYEEKKVFPIWIK
jgi:S-methylmethionine-dependent homocysteine/selenocysteine methylase